MQHDKRICSAHVVVVMENVWVVAQMQKELSYKCNSGFGRTMGSCIGYNNVKDGRWHA